MNHLIDEAYRLFDGLPVSLTEANGREIARGHFMLVMGADPTAPAALNVEFSTRGVTFMLGIPDDALPTLARTWTGDHFVLERPAGEWEWLRTPPDH